MREKAKASLERLEKMKPRRQYVTISNDIMTSWHKCKVDLAALDRLSIMDWANRKCLGQYSRDWDCYYFENEKDAFAFKLKWGSK